MAVAHRRMSRLVDDELAQRFEAAVCSGEGRIEDGQDLALRFDMVEQRQQFSRVSYDMRDIGYHQFAAGLHRLEQRGQAIPVRSFVVGVGGCFDRDRSAPGSDELSDLKHCFRICIARTCVTVSNNLTNRRALPHRRRTYFVPAC